MLLGHLAKALFPTASVTSGRTQSEHNESAVPREADIGARGRHVALGPILLQNYFQRSGTQY
jgi:hypothetical protein